MKIAIYPGTFDPITNGHLDIIKKAVKIFDKVIVAIGINPHKKCTFSMEERVYLTKESVKLIDEKEKVIVEPFEGLLVDFAKKKGASVIIRGLRAVSDFEYEMQLALMNKKLSNIDTIFFVPELKWIFLSSSIIKEIAKFGGDIQNFVPEIVVKKLREKFNNKGEKPPLLKQT